MLAIIGFFCSKSNKRKRECNRHVGMWVKKGRKRGQSRGSEKCRHKGTCRKRWKGQQRENNRKIIVCWCRHVYLRRQYFTCLSACGLMVMTGRCQRFDPSSILGPRQILFFGLGPKEVSTLSHFPASQIFSPSPTCSFMSALFWVSRNVVGGMGFCCD